MFGIKKINAGENRLERVYSFENRGFMRGDRYFKTKIFPDVDKTGLNLQWPAARKRKLNWTMAFKSKFYLHDPGDFIMMSIYLSINRWFLRFSPENLSIMEFRQERDYELCCKIRKWQISVRRKRIPVKNWIFHMTNDSHLFPSEK